MRYHTGYPEKYWKFLYSLDAFLFFVAAVFTLSLIAEFGFYLEPLERLILSWFNIFVLVISITELLIKFILSSSKKYFFNDEYFDLTFTSLLFIVALYV